MFIYGKTSANAIAVMSYLAAHPGRRSGTADIVQSRGISRPLAAKLLTQLATAGLVTGQPGPGGGYTLARPPDQIRLIDIASLFEHMDAPTFCPFGFNWCGKGDPCPLHDKIAEIQEISRRFLMETNLSVFAAEAGLKTPAPARVPSAV